jgi:hypothetical protein
MQQTCAEGGGGDLLAAAARSKPAQVNEHMCMVEPHNSLFGGIEWPAEV